MTNKLTMTNPLKAKLAAGIPVLGIWSIIPSPIVAEIMCLSGLDFAILDMEHGIFEMSTLDACVRAVEIAGAAPIVRTPGMNAFAVQWALDLGSHGIIVPQIRHADDAAAVVGMAKYAPMGVRGYNPFTRAANYANPKDNRMGKLDNGFSLTSVIIESKSALEDLEAICKTPGIDVVYMGIYDLAVILGYDGNTRHPDVVKIVDDAIAQIRLAGKAAGMMVRDNAEMDRALNLGANFLVYGVDTFLIRDAAAQGVASFARSLRDFSGTRSNISSQDPL